MFLAIWAVLPQKRITSAPSSLSARRLFGGSKETMIAILGQTRWSPWPPASVIEWRSELIGQIPGMIIPCSWSSITTRWQAGIDPTTAPSSFTAMSTTVLTTTGFDGSMSGSIASVPSPFRNRKSSTRPLQSIRQSTRMGRGTYSASGTLNPRLAFWIGCVLGPTGPRGASLTATPGRCGEFSPGAEGNSPSINTDVTTDVTARFKNGPQRPQTQKCA